MFSVNTIVPLVIVDNASIRAHVRLKVAVTTIAKLRQIVAPLPYSICCVITTDAIGNLLQVS